MPTPEELIILHRAFAKLTLEEHRVVCRSIPLDTATLFCVMKNMDETEGRGPIRNVGTEGRGPIRNVGTFTTEAEALKAAKGINPYGRDADVEPLKVYGSFEVWVRDVPPNDTRDYNRDYYKLTHKLMDPKELLRLQALSKLTPEEAAALGVKP